MADIFVSFTKSDRQWAHWIAQELTALDHEPHVHDWEIGPGEDIVGWMEKRTTRRITCSASFPRTT